MNQLRLRTELVSSRLSQADNSFVDGDQINLSEQAGNLVTLLSTGFHDPAANRNGPGVSVVGASSSGSVVVGKEDEEGVDLPTEFAVHGVYPNPLALQATVRYTVPRTERVRIGVYDVIGRRVATLRDADEPPGVKEIPFRSQGLASGLYFL